MKHTVLKITGIEPDSWIIFWGDSLIFRSKILMKLSKWEEKSVLLKICLYFSVKIHNFSLVLAK